MYLIIDNYDSFVFNLADYVHQTGHTTEILFNDTVTIDYIKLLRPQGIIISPGPKHPKDIINVIKIIHYFYDKIPILGVCLGHQAIGYAFGATVAQSFPAHGFSTPINHNDSVLFKGINQNIPVGRYHSLSIIDDDTFPKSLTITAKTFDSNHIIMAIEHKLYPVFGVQFHPESILTDSGLQIIHNFVTL
jgi:anthranilate synthase/aminodeoxychorismate synthase-like glutamine amidotransferase